MQATKAGINCKHTASSNNAGLQKRPAPMQATKVSINWKPMASSQLCWPATETSTDASHSDRCRLHAHTTGSKHFWFTNEHGTDASRKGEQYLQSQGD